MVERPEKTNKDFMLMNKWYQYKVDRVAELELEKLELQEKVRRRNLQIKSLKKQLAKEEVNPFLLTSKA